MSQIDPDHLGTVDAFAPEHRADPHPQYHRLRQESPILELPERGGWLLTRYEDCSTVLEDQRWSSNPAHLVEPDPRTSLRTRAGDDGDPHVILFLDPPDHTRIRGLIKRQFTRGAVERFRDGVEQLTGDLLDEAAEKGRIDLMTEFAYQVPVIVICEILGVPVEDRDVFPDWSSDASRLLDVDTDPEVVNRGITAMANLAGYFADLFDQRRDDPRDDLLSAMVAAEAEGKLTPEELQANTITLFVAGHETTMNLIGNGTLALLKNPDQLARLRDDPGLVASAVEEVLRYDGPVHVTGRIATEDLEVGSHRFARGERVVTLLAAANRDPAEFADPDRFDVGRDPNYHLAFSKGMHHCLGSWLARLEGQVALGMLVDRFPDLKLVDENPEYREHFVLRGLSELQVDLGTPAPA